MIFQKAFDLVTNFILSFFREKKKPTRFTEEIWTEDFLQPQKSRYKNESFEKYCYEVIPEKGLLFKLERKNLFAWCLPPDSNYSDFDAECSFSFKSSDAYCSGGIIFRMGNDFNYYYFLVSNKGYFRVDCVFNGKPMKLIEWTKIGFELEADITLRVTAWDTYFVFYVNNIQVARFNDETVGSGSITFCAQNYDAMPAAEILFKKINVNSIPEEVEKLYSEKDEIPASQKIILIKSFFSNGQFVSAAVQMKSYLNNLGKEETTDELLGFYGEILLNLGMYDEALKQFNEALDKKPEEKNYLLEKANLLYQLGKYEELQEFLLGIENMFEDNALYWHLRGHSMYHLGNYEACAEFYKKATELDKENPLYFVNLAKTYETLGDKEKSAFYFAEGSLLFFRQNNYPEADNAASFALKKETGNAETEVKAKGVLAKILFSEGKSLKAEEEFKNLTETFPDLCGSEIFFLYALIKTNQGKYSEAIPLIEKACEKEEYYLYWYKLAEIFNLIGKDPQEPLAKAYTLSPDDIWVNNFLGELALRKGDAEQAEKYFEKAFSVGKNSVEVIPAVNYSEVLIINNKAEQALAVLEAFPMDQDKEVLLQTGKIYDLLEKEKESEKIYKKLLTLYPKDKNVIRAVASFYYSSEQYGKAEEILLKVDDLETDSSLLNIAGNIAKVLGNFSVAFSAYEKSLAISYNPVVAINYIEGLCEVLNFKEAKNKFEQYFNSGSNYLYADKGKMFNDKSEKIQERLERLRTRIESKTEKKFACASCNMEWKVPNDVPDSDSKLKLVGDPDPFSPAGQCPTCSKIYCVKCASEKIEEGRFKCPDCNENLKLSDKYLRYLALKSASKE